MDRSRSGGRPGIVAVTVRDEVDRQWIRGLRESIETSWTVVIGPRSGIVAFRRRTIGC